MVAIPVSRVAKGQCPSHLCQKTNLCRHRIRSLNVVMQTRHRRNMLHLLQMQLTSPTRSTSIKSGYFSKKRALGAGLT